MYAKKKEITANGRRHGESARKMVVRLNENVEMVVILEMKKKIVTEHDDYI